MTHYPPPTAFFPASCFGKLPAFGDFVRHNAGGRDILAFDGWLQQGLHHARAQLRGAWDESFRHAPAYHFLFFPENSESFLLGVLWPSHDRSERRFPFIVSLRIDRRLPAGMLALAPTVFTPFFDGARALMSQAGQGMALHDVAGATAALRAPVARDYDAVLRMYRQHLATTPIDGLWQRLWRDASNDRACLVFKNLIEILSPLRGRNPERLALGLRFPLPPDDGLAFTVSFWTDVAFRLVGGNATRPFLFWTSPSAMHEKAIAGNGTTSLSATHPRLVVFLRQPTPRSMLHLLRPDIDSDFICEIDADGFDGLRCARTALPTWLRAALEEPATSLAGLLDTLAARGVDATVRSGVPC